MGYNFSLKSGAADRIYNTLDGLCLTLSATDYLELPERIDRIHHVELPWVMRTFYAELEREFIAEMATDTVEVLSATTLSNKLLQNANGAVYTGDAKDWTPYMTSNWTRWSRLSPRAPAARFWSRSTTKLTRSASATAFRRPLNWAGIPRKSTRGTGARYQCCWRTPPRLAAGSICRQAGMCRSGSASTGR